MVNQTKGIVKEEKEENNTVGNEIVIERLPNGKFNMYGNYSDEDFKLKHKRLSR